MGAFIAYGLPDCSLMSALIKRRMEEEKNEEDKKEEEEKYEEEEEQKYEEKEEEKEEEEKEEEEKEVEAKGLKDLNPISVEYWQVPDVSSTRRNFLLYLKFVFL